MKKLYSVICICFAIVILCCASPSFAALVGYWSFENSATDSSGYGNDGTLVGSATYAQQSAEFGSSLYLDGSGANMRVADSDSLDFSDQYTISIWLNPSDVSSYMFFLTKWVDGGGSLRSYHFAITDEGQLRATMFTGSRMIDEYNTADIQANEWQHVAIVYDNATNRLETYVNGQLIALDTVGGNINISTADMLVGTYISSLSAYSFNGYIDELRMFNTALTSEQILDEYNMSYSSGSDTAVPEPLSITLFALSLIGVRFARRS